MSPEQPSTCAANKSQNDAVNATSFTDLNDDCLFEIFKYLSLDDLTQILPTCKQFNKIAQLVFLQKFRQHRIEVNSSCISAWHNGQNITCKHHYQRPPNFLNFFHYVGKFVTELSIHFDKQLTASHLQGCLINNCSETLTKLRLSGIDLYHGFGTLTKIFPKVEELSLYSVDGNGTDIELLLNCFPYVTQLELINCHAYNYTYEKRDERPFLCRVEFRPDIIKLFPRLQHFKYGDDIAYFQTGLLESVMSSPGLRSLSIGMTSRVTPGLHLLKGDIKKIPPNLETLELWNIIGFLHEIPLFLPRLRKLIVNNPLQRAYPFQSIPPFIEELILGALEIPIPIISQILRMKTLKKLTLHTSGRESEGWFRFRQISDQDLQQLAMLPNLEELTIKQSSNSITVHSIRRFILSCKTLKRLTLIYFKENKKEKEQFHLNDFGANWKVFENFMAVGIARQP